MTVRNITGRSVRLICAGIAVTGLLTSQVSAQSGGSYELTWSTIDAGAGVVTGGGYTLTGLIGQPDAGPVAAGGDYTLSGGFLQPSLFADSNSSVYDWILY